MIDRKFLMVTNKLKDKKLKSVLCIMVEKGLTISDKIYDLFKDFSIKIVSVGLDHKPLTILNIIRNNWKKEELNNKKGDLLFCIARKYFDLSGFKELLESNLKSNEKLEFRNFDKGNFIIITYYKTKKKKERFSAVLKSLDNSQLKELEKPTITPINLPQVDSDYKNLH